MMSDNDFGRMIEDLIIVTNSRLKIESVHSKVKYTQAELQRQQYFAFVAEQMQDKMKNYSQAPYIYSDPRSRSTEVLNEQGGQGQNPKKVNVYSQEQPNKSSVKQLIFNVNSELQINQQPPQSSEQIEFIENQSDNNNEKTYEGSNSNIQLKQNQAFNEKSKMQFPELGQQTLQETNYSDGFTLVKGITALGFRKLRMKNFEKLKLNQGESSKFSTPGPRRKRNKTFTTTDYFREFQNMSGLTQVERLPQIDNGRHSFYTQSTQAANEEMKILRAAPLASRERRGKVKKPSHAGYGAPYKASISKRQLTVPKRRSPKFEEFVLDSSQCNSTTENFIKNQHGVHLTEGRNPWAREAYWQQQAAGYDFAEKSTMPTPTPPFKADNYGFYMPPYSLPNGSLMQTPLGDYAGSPKPFGSGSPVPHDNYSRIANLSASPFHTTQPLAATHHIIEEEDYQSSMKGSAHQLSNNDITPSFQEGSRSNGRAYAQKQKAERHVEDSDDDRSQKPREFLMQKADFEIKSYGTETASEDQQPSVYRRNEFDLLPEQIEHVYMAEHKMRHPEYASGSHYSHQ